MSDAEFQTIKATEGHSEGSKEQLQTIGSPTIGGGTSPKPRSVNSSEGRVAISYVARYVDGNVVVFGAFTIASPKQCADASFVSRQWTYLNF